MPDLSNSKTNCASFSCKSPFKYVSFFEERIIWCWASLSWTASFPMYVEHALAARANVIGILEVVHKERNQAASQQQPAGQKLSKAIGFLWVCTKITTSWLPFEVDLVVAKGLSPTQHKHKAHEPRKDPDFVADARGDLSLAGWAGGQRRRANEPRLIAHKLWPGSHRRKGRTWRDRGVAKANA